MFGLPPIFHAAPQRYKYGTLHCKERHLRLHSRRFSTAHLGQAKVLHGESECPQETIVDAVRLIMYSLSFRGSRRSGSKKRPLPSLPKMKAAFSVLNFLMEALM
mmetsp:Transcript_34106/g.59490  ORF Transcript_34106/g.59490 Transcript_34106/m.59490 type:complete len:104 (-) Transcript_34106:2360-2671(-)